MAKGRRAANLAGLAALGALGYAMYNRDREAKTGGSGPQIVPSDYYIERGQGAPASARDVEEHVFTGPLGETGGAGRSEVSARDQASLPPIDRNAQASFAQSGPAAAQARPAAAQARVAAAAPSAQTLTDAGPGRAVGKGGATAAELNAYQQAKQAEAQRGYGYNRAPAPAVIGPRSTGKGGATAAEMTAYQRSQQAEAQRGRGQNRADMPSAPRAASSARTTPMTREERISQIPTGGTRTVSGGERVSGNEFTRNLGNTLNATAGLSAPGFVGNMTQKQYNALAALRRQEEGLSAAEAAAAKQAAREAKTLNPMAWMAGPKGMSENFKKGGAVKAKKMASGGASSASKRGDGIASRGKTKCKMY